MSKDFEALKDLVLSTIEVSLESQLKAIRKLKSGDAVVKDLKEEGMSQVDMAYDILKRTGKPLHVSELIELINKHFSISVDRESLVSAITKKVSRKVMFQRTDKNTFATIGKNK